MARAGFWAIESHTIRFGRDGHWYSDGERIAHPRIADLFSRHLHAEADGSFWLRLGDERARVEIDDTPWVVVRIDGQPADGVILSLNDGSREPLEPASLRLGDGDVLYCRVKSGAHEARFLRAPQTELLAHAHDGPDSRFRLSCPGGREVVLEHRPPLAHRGGSAVDADPRPA